MSMTEERTDEWHQWRREGVTATDVADAAAGTYGGTYGVVARKLGVEVVEENDAMRRGTRWQPVIADAVHVLTGYHVVGEETWCQHPEDARWRATVDGFLAPTAEATLEDVVAVFECKTRGATARPDRSRWHAQMQWQMGVTGIGRALLAEATIDDNTDSFVGLRVEWVEANEAEFDRLCTYAETVHAHTIAGTLPDPDTASALELVKATNGEADTGAEAVDLADIADDVARLGELKAAVKMVSDEAAAIEARIRHAMGAATKGHAPGWKVSVSVPANVLTADGEAALLADHPEWARTVLDRDAAKAADLDAYKAACEPVGARRLTITATD